MRMTRRVNTYRVQRGFSADVYELYEKLTPRQRRRIKKKVHRPKLLVAQDELKEF